MPKHKHSSFQQSYWTSRNTLGETLNSTCTIYNGFEKPTYRSNEKIMPQSGRNNTN